MEEQTHSIIGGGLDGSDGAASGELDLVMADDERDPSTGEAGMCRGSAALWFDPSLVTVGKGALWGRGEMSIKSMGGPGDDEGRGGVVVDSVSRVRYSVNERTLMASQEGSHRSSPLVPTAPIKADVNSERRGVTSCGLSSTKRCQRCLRLPCRPGLSRADVRLHTYLWSMWKFWDRSAARLAVGDEPRTGFRVK